MITRLKFRSGLFLDRFSIYQRPVQASRTLAQRCSCSPLRQIGHNAFRKVPLDTRLRPLRSVFPGRILSFLTIAVLCGAGGFFWSIYPMYERLGHLLQSATDEETLTMYTPPDEAAREIEEFINNHPLARQLRSMPEYSESRPHLKIPQAFRSHNLTGGTLMGPGRIVVPPFTWTEKGGKSLVSISYLGTDLCGHPGIVHGGFLATMCDEGLARCSFGALPNKVAVTASLKLDYRKPAPAGSFIVLRAWTTKVEGRKAWVTGRLETLEDEGKDPVVLVEASALFIEPKRAALMTRIFPVT